MPVLSSLIRFGSTLATAARRLNGWLSAERGMAGTGIAMLTMALSGSVFAGAIVENGDISTEQFASVFQSSLNHVSGSMEVRGAVVVTATGAPLAPDTIQFTLATFGQLPPTAMDPAQTGGLVISYRDANAVANDVPYTVRFSRGANGDNNLDAGETATVSIRVADLQSIAGKAVLPAGKQWTLDLQTADTALEFSRTHAAVLQQVNVER